MTQTWLNEWNKFSEQAIMDMKRYSDETNKQRECMCYVYDVNGVYQLGEPSYGGRSKIEVSPEKKGAEDKKKNGYTEVQRKWTIHGHPLKDGKIYTGRQYFSSTDICREFVKSRDNDEYIVQFLVFPHKQTDTNTGKAVIHNRCRILIFPNRETILRAMKDSNPHVDGEQITAQNGQNQSVQLDDGSTTLKNQMDIDWFAFQEALGKYGFMGIVDIEGPLQGAKSFNSESLKDAPTLLGFAVAGLIAVFAIKRIKSNSSFLNMNSVEVVDGFGAECQGYH